MKIKWNVTKLIKWNVTKLNKNESKNCIISHRGLKIIVIGIINLTERDFALTKLKDPSERVSKKSKRRTLRKFAGISVLNVFCEFIWNSILIYCMSVTWSSNKMLATRERLVHCDVQIV